MSNDHEHHRSHGEQESPTIGIRAYGFKGVFDFAQT
jgi:hypothetical protein